MLTRGYDPRPIVDEGAGGAEAVRPGRGAIVSANRKKMRLEGLKAPRLVPGAWLSSVARPMLARHGVVTYSVLSETAKPAERRAEPRRPVHLQSGKILGHKNRFLTEFLFKNRTRIGIRVKLARGVPLPKTVLLFDDQQGVLLAADVVWQHGSDAGCRLSHKPMRLDDKLLARLRGPYYAVR